MLCAFVSPHVSGHVLKAAVIFNAWAMLVFLGWWLGTPQLATTPFTYPICFPLPVKRHNKRIVPVHNYLKFQVNLILQRRKTRQLQS